jgi:hypothetical protein
MDQKEIKGEETGVQGAMGLTGIKVTRIQVIGETGLLDHKGIAGTNSANGETGTGSAIGLASGETGYKE